jgi:hypothetical protein
MSLKYNSVNGKLNVLEIITITNTIVFNYNIWASDSQYDLGVLG